MNEARGQRATCVAHVSVLLTSDLEVRSAGDEVSFAQCVVLLQSIRRWYSYNNKTNNCHAVLLAKNKKKTITNLCNVGCCSCWHRTPATNLSHGATTCVNSS